MNPTQRAPRVESVTLDYILRYTAIYSNQGAAGLFWCQVTGTSRYTGPQSQR